MTVRELWNKYSNLYAEEDHFIAEIAFYHGAKSVLAQVTHDITLLESLYKEANQDADIVRILRTLPSDTTYKIESIDHESETCSLRFEREGKSFLCRLVPLSELKKVHQSVS